MSNARRRKESTGQIYTLGHKLGEHNTIIEQSASPSRRVLPQGFAVGTRLNGYGGGAYTIDRCGSFIFAESRNGGVYELDPATSQVDNLVAGLPGRQYADFDANPCSPQWVVAVCSQGPRQIGQCIVLINRKTKEVHTLIHGSDFYLHPRFSPCGTRLLWMQWTLPYMPWNGAVLYTAELNGTLLVKHKRIAGEPGKFGVSQPRWGPDGSFYFVYDVTGYWQLYHVAPKAQEYSKIRLQGLETVDFAAAEFYVRRFELSLFEQDLFLHLGVIALAFTTLR